MSANKIAWFGGNVEQAFEAARVQNKPLFLYWGAVWCPPCHELKATVFQQAEFVQASRQYVALQLDGDQPRAQQLAERFDVVGYPTLVVFNAEGQELTRIPNGLDIQAYADILQTAMQKLRPVSRLIEQIEQPDGRLSAQECRVLAKHSWEQDPNDYPPQRLSEVFKAAWQACAEPDKADLYALHLLQLQQGDIKLSTEQREQASARLIDYLSVDAVLANLYLWQNAGAYLQPYLQADALFEAFESVYMSLADQDRQSVFVRIQSLRGLIGLLQTREQAIPSAVIERVVRLGEAAQKMDRTDPQFHATINATGNVLREAGLLSQAKELLSDQIKHSKYAYYFMSELAHVEYLLGNPQQAVQWLRSAYQQARGPATRFQWGVEYLQGLLTMDADNLTAIDKGFNEVLTELSSANQFYQRSRMRLQHLDQAFRDWAINKPTRLEALKDFRRRAQSACSMLPGNSDAQSHCSDFLREAA